MKNYTSTRTTIEQVTSITCDACNKVTEQYIGYPWIANVEVKLNGSYGSQLDGLEQWDLCDSCAVDLKKLLEKFISIRKKANHGKEKDSKKVSSKKASQKGIVKGRVRRPSANSRRRNLSRRSK